MEKVGFDKVEIDPMGNIFGWIGHGSHLIAMDGHIDNVGVGDINNWTVTGPFEPKVIGDEIYGRGGSDQEGGMVSMVYAGKIIKDLHLEDDYTLLVVGSVQEEDCDGLCWQYIVNEDKIRPEFVLITEPTSLRIYRGHRGRMEIKVRTPGISCHGSAPERGDNAIYKMAPIINEIRALNENLHYERLSRDDELQGESNSIVNQKKILEEYAKKNHLENIIHFTDDGISGTQFDRPGFMAMMNGVNQGNIGCIIVKDMSRLGRDYLKVGQCMEILRQKGVRLIAINDNVDSFYKDDDFTPFRNIMNEWYARDTSRKIKSTFKTKGESGKHTGSSPPYGYIKDKDDKNQWIIDEKAAEVVRRIFHLTMDGKGPYAIARILEADKIDIPAYHQQKLGYGLHQSKVFEYPYRWCSSTIASILKKQEYLGHTVNFKTRKHFKDKKSKYVSEDNWLIFENTHEPIIDQETFDNVQRIRGNVKRYPDGWGEYHPLTGLMYCADCGSKMNGSDRKSVV